MKAVVHDGPCQVRVKDVPDARIERPTDGLVRITTTDICGSGLRMYESRTGFELGRWFGHANTGQEVEVANGSTRSESATVSSCRSTSPSDARSAVAELAAAR